MRHTESKWRRAALSKRTDASRDSPAFLRARPDTAARGDLQPSWMETEKAASNIHGELALMIGSRHARDHVAPLDLFGDTLRFIR